MRHLVVVDVPVNEDLIIERLQPVVELRVLTLLFGSVNCITDILRQSPVVFVPVGEVPLPFLTFHRVTVLRGDF